MSNSVKTVGNIFIIILLSKLMGQAREMMLAAYYGTGEAAQAFLTATQIPLNFFDMILGVAIVSAFVPVFNEYLVSGGRKEANRFANNFVGIVTVISGLVSIIGVVFSYAITSLLAKGLNPSALDMASKLLKIMFPSMIFTAVSYTYAGVLQSMGQFKIPAAMSLVSNAVAIIYFLTLNKSAGVYGLAVSMLIGWMLQLVILLPSLIKKGFKFGIAFNFAESGMKKVYRLAFPILLSSWVQPLNVMFNTYIASFLNGGAAVAALNYANKLYIIIAGVFTMSVTNLILPSLSRDFSAGNDENCAVTIKNSVNSVILFLMPVMALFVVFRTQIVEIIYQRGTFDAQSASLTSSALLYYSFGMIGYGLQEVLNKSFYAMQKSKIPMRTAFLTIAVNILLSLALKGIMGIKGLALSAAISATVGGITLLIMIKKHIELICVKDIVLTLAKALISGAVSGLTAYFVYTSFFGGLHGVALIFGLGVCGVCALAMYIILLVLLKVDEIKKLKSILLKK